MPDLTEPDAQPIEAAMHDLVDTMVSPVRAAALGYRTQLLAENVPVDIANEMMKDMHRLLCRALGGETATTNDGEGDA